MLEVVVEFNNSGTIEVAPSQMLHLVGGLPGAVVHIHGRLLEPTLPTRLVWLMEWFSFIAVMEI